MQIFLLFTFLERRKTIVRGEIEDRPMLGTYQPSVVIVVPCFNEERSLKGTVESILALRYPAEKLRVAIVDDGSTDNTRAVADAFVDNSRVMVISKENGGKHTALNEAIKITESELIGCLDADSFVHEDALIEVVKVFEDKKIMAVTPAMKVYNPENILQKMQKVEYDIGIFLRKMFGDLNGLHVTPGPFSIFRRSVFSTIGLYRKAHNTEDLEIALRMHKYHLPIANAHRAFVYTITPRTIKALYKQRLRWVCGFLKNAIDYRELFFNRGYGNLGVITLPTAVFSIISALFFAFLAVMNLAEMGFEQILKLITIGVHFSRDMFMFDWFFFNTGFTAFLIYTLLSTTVLMIFVGKKMAENNMRISADMLYFIMFYGILAPIWLFKAVYNVLFSRATTWR
jgi:cellulose synthase/poly-beta-1,6-N-acetylglucosamine synthase-like glycosyltransferase